MVNRSNGHGGWAGGMLALLCVGCGVLPSARWQESGAKLERLEIRSDTLRTSLAGRDGSLLEVRWMAVDYSPPDSQGRQYRERVSWARAVRRDSAERTARVRTEQFSTVREAEVRQTEEGMERTGAGGWKWVFGAVGGLLLVGVAAQWRKRRVK